jgi:hypothetical protein
MIRYIKLLKTQAKLEVDYYNILQKFDNLCLWKNEVQEERDRIVKNYNIDYINLLGKYYDSLQNKKDKHHDNNIIEHLTEKYEVLTPKVLFENCQGWRIKGSNIKGISADDVKSTIPYPDRAFIAGYTADMVNGVLVTRLIVGFNVSLDKYAHALTRENLSDMLKDRVYKISPRKYAQYIMLENLSNIELY